MKEQVPSWLGFCHNDLQYGNMLLHVSSPQVQSSSIHTHSPVHHVIFAAKRTITHVKGPEADGTPVSGSNIAKTGVP